MFIKINYSGVRYVDFPLLKLLEILAVYKTRLKITFNGHVIAISQNIHHNHIMTELGRTVIFY